MITQLTPMVLCECLRFSRNINWRVPWPSSHLLEVNIYPVNSRFAFQPSRVTCPERHLRSKVQSEFNPDSDSKSIKSREKAATSMERRKRTRSHTTVITFQSGEPQGVDNFPYLRLFFFFFWGFPKIMRNTHMTGVLAGLLIVRFPTKAIFW